MSTMSNFHWIDLGILYYFLGLKVYSGDHGFFTSRKKYMLDMLNVELQGFSTGLTC